MNLKDFIGSTQIILQTNTGAGSIYRLQIFTPFSEKFTEDIIPQLYVSEKSEDYLQQESFNTEVENGYHQNELEKLQTPLVDILPFYYKSTKTYLLDRYTRFTTMEEVMREYVNEVSVRRNKDDYHLMTLNEPAYKIQDRQLVDLLIKDNPLVLLDGVPVFNINKIIVYDPLKVQKLEVVAARYYWGLIIADGIVSYTTYKGDLEGYTLDPNDIVLDYDALQQKRIFYSSDYSSDKELHSTLPDYRDVLFWSPEINTGEKVKALFLFTPAMYPVNMLLCCGAFLPMVMREAQALSWMWRNKM